MSSSIIEAPMIPSQYPVPVSGVRCPSSLFIHPRVSAERTSIAKAMGNARMIG